MPEFCYSSDLLKFEFPADNLPMGIGWRYYINNDRMADEKKTVEIDFYEGLNWAGSKNGLKIPGNFPRSGMQAGLLCSCHNIPGR